MSIRILPSFEENNLNGPASTLFRQIQRKEKQILFNNYRQEPRLIPFPVVLQIGNDFSVEAFTTCKPCAQPPNIAFQYVDQQKIVANLDRLNISFEQLDGMLVIRFPPILTEIPLSLNLGEFEPLIHPVFFNGQPIMLKYCLLDQLKAAYIRQQIEAQPAQLSEIVLQRPTGSIILPIYGAVTPQSNQIIQIDEKLKRSALKRMRFYNYTEEFIQNPTRECGNQTLRSAFVQGVYETKTGSIQERDLLEMANELGSENVCQKYPELTGK